MQHPALIPVVKYALRKDICPVCIERPAGSETLGPTEPRSCEGECPIFNYTAKLIGIAVTARGARTAPVEHMVLDHVCDQCDHSETAGEFCADRFTRSCPLSVHYLKVIEAIEPVIALHLGAAAKA
jgi:hypothetical protein